MNGQNLSGMDSHLLDMGSNKITIAQECMGSHDILYSEDRLDKGLEPLYYSPWENYGHAFLQKHAIVNLWDMIIFCIQPLCKQLCGLQERQDKLLELIEDYPETANTSISEEMVDKYNNDLNIILEGIEQTGLIAAPKLIKQILSRLSDMSFMRLHENIIQLREMIINELKEVLLIFIPREKAIWLEKERNVNAQFAQSFPSALDDYKEVVFCYASGRYIATVFHSMRILEYGLKALAEDIGLIFDVQQWGTIIDQIEKEIGNIRKTMPKGPAKSERLQFLSEAAKEFAYFKDGWRNYVSHRRATYDGPQALSAINHVKAFMLHLSRKLSE